MSEFLAVAADGAEECSNRTLAGRIEACIFHDLPRPLALDTYTHEPGAEPSVRWGSYYAAVFTGGAESGWDSAASFRIASPRVYQCSVFGSR
jgi:hypothetical protein